MKLYKIRRDLGFTKIEGFTWTTAEQGAKSIRRKLPMLKSEADTFQEMEKMGITKNIEPGRTFIIEAAQ